MFLQFCLFAPKKRKDGKTQICCDAKRRKKRKRRSQNCEPKRRKDAKLRGERRKDEILGRSFAVCVYHLFAFILSSFPVFSGQNDKKPKKTKFNCTILLALFNIIRMAMSKAVPDEDRTRFCRLSLVIVEELPLILQDVLHREVSPNLLPHMVMKHKNGLEHLGQHQIIQVYNAKASGYSEFDITLLYTLLRNYFKKSIQAPTKGWGKQEMPEQGQETEGDDIERIRLIRNKHNHSVMVSVPAISETEFNEKWGIIHAVCARMQTRLPNIQHNYVQMLEESKIRTIDSDMEKTYIDKIKELAKEEMSVKTLLLELVQEKGSSYSHRL